MLRIRDKAIIAILWDIGARISEVGTLTIRQAVGELLRNSESKIGQNVICNFIVHAKIN